MINRRTFVFSIAAIIPLFGAAALAQDNDKHRGHDDDDDDHHHDDHHHDDHHHDDHEHGREHGDDHHFRQQDYDVIQRYYSGPRNLPPGLQKKYARTGTLPPGWERRYRPFPPQLVAQLPPPPPNCERGYIDGQAVVFDRSTHAIVDSFSINIAIGVH